MAEVQPLRALRYEPATGVLTVTTASLPTTASHTVTFAGNGSQLSGPGGRCVDVANAMYACPLGSRLGFRRSIPFDMHERGYDRYLKLDLFATQRGSGR